MLACDLCGQRPVAHGTRPPSPPPSQHRSRARPRSQDNERAAALAQQLRALNEGSAEGRQLEEQYPAFLRYDRKGLTAALCFLAAPELPQGLLDWALGLTRLHMAVRACRPLLLKSVPAAGVIGPSMHLLTVIGNTNSLRHTNFPPLALCRCAGAVRGLPRLGVERRQEAR